MDSAVTTEAEAAAITARWADAGQIMSVFCGDPRYRDLSGLVLSLKIMPALSHGQYAIARVATPLAEPGVSLPAPVAAILYARVSAEIHARFLAATEVPRLGMADWNCGPHTWIIDAPGDQKVVGSMLNDLHRDRFDRQPFGSFINRGPGDVTARMFGT